MLTSTLTSLAMLKINADVQNRDYLDYLRPFLLEILRNEKPDPVTDLVMQQYFRDCFGLEIPARAIQIVLKRLARTHVLKKNQGRFNVSGHIPNTGFKAAQAAARRHIDAVVGDFISFSGETLALIVDDTEAIEALSAFLTKFSIECLSAYLRGTALPVVETRNKHIVAVSKFVSFIARNNPERFESFIILTKGHMLANALLCPDLTTVPHSFRKVTFYLDTPLVVRLLGLEGEYRQRAIEETRVLLKKLGGTIAVFSHTRDEIEKVIKGAADHIESPAGRGAVVLEMRRQGRTRSDLYLLAGQLEQKLAENQIEVRRSPRYVDQSQIDELVFEEALSDEIHYYNPRAREYDINSVRSVYAIRRGSTPSSLENSRAVLVTSNAGFAKAAYRYGRDIEESRAVSSVVTDFSVANVAWLKAPMGAPDLPAKEVLAYSFAALQPSGHLWEAYLEETDRLKESGHISARDHQLLRLNLRAREELMDLTLGETAELTQGTVSQILERVEAEIRAEDKGKLIEEQTEHEETRDQLRLLKAKQESLQKRWYWRTRRVATIIVFVLDAALTLALLATTVIGLYLIGHEPLWITVVSPIGFLLFIGAMYSLLNQFLGVSVRDLHYRIRDWLHLWLFKALSRVVLGSSDDSRGQLRC